MEGTHKNSILVLQEELDIIEDEDIEIVHSDKNKYIRMNKQVSNHQKLKYYDTFVACKYFKINKMSEIFAAKHPF